MESQLTVTDISLMATVLDLAMARGAFKASEAKEIGQLFDKLTAFVEMVNSHTEAAKAAEAEAAAAVTESQTAETEAA